MANKIKTSDIIDPNFLEDPIKQSETFLKVIKGIKDEFSEILQISKKQVQENPLESFEDADKLAKEVEKINLATKELNELEEKRLKLEKQLLEAQKADVKTQTAIKIQLQETNKTLKETIKLELAEKNSIEQLRTQNKLLITERNKLNVNTLEGQKRLNEINKELDLNNKIIKENVSQYEKQKINIGNYKQSIEEALSSTGLFSKELGFLKEATEATRLAFKGTIEDLRGIVKGTDGVASGASKATKAFRLLGTGLKASGIGAALLVLSSAASFFTTFEEGLDSVGRATLQLEASFGVLTRRLGDFFSKLREGDFVNPFKGISEEISKASENAKRLFEIIDAYEDRLFVVKQRVSALSIEEEKYSQIVGDQTVSFAEREKAELSLTEVTKERFRLEAILAKRELENEVRRIALNKLGSIEQKNLDKVNKALETGTFTRQLTSKALEKALQLQLDYNNALAQQERNEQTILATSRERLDKETKLKVNIIQDLSKVTLENNKKIIESEKELLDIRATALAEYEQLSQTAFDQEIEALQKRTKIRIDTNKLLSIESGAELSEAVVQAGLGTKLTAELEQILIERRKQLEELDKFRKQVIGGEDIKNLKPIGIDTTSVDEANKKFLKTIEDQNSARLKQLELEEQARLESLQAEKELEKKRQQQVLDTFNLTLEKINEQKQAEINALDEVIAKRESNVNKQQDLAEKGLTNQLAFEQQKLDEAEAERARLQREQEKREKRIAFYKAFAAALESAKDTGNFGSASAEALAQVLIAETIAGAFKDGVENLQGEGTSTSDSILARLSKGESVLTAKGTSEFAGLPTAINNGEGREWIYKNILPEMIASQDKNVTVVTDNKLISEIQDLKKVIKNKTEVNVNWNSLDERVESLVKDGMRQTVKHVRKRPKI